MESLSKADERMLLDGVKVAVDLVDNQGLSPDAAMQKVAEKYQYSPGFLKAACNAFNTGRQLAQWQANEPVLDKLASFPLADFEKISAKIWNKATEKQAHVAMTTPKFNSYTEQARQELLHMDLSGFVKQASEMNQQTVDELANDKIKKAYDHLDYYTRLADQTRTDKAAAANKLDASLSALRGYFSKSAYDRLPFAQVEHAVSAYYGKVGSALLDHVAEFFPGEKRAAAQPRHWEGFYRGVDRNKAPFTLIDSIIKQAETYQQALSRLDAANAKVMRANAAVVKLATDLVPANETAEALNPSLIDESNELEGAGDSEKLDTNATTQTDNDVTPDIVGLQDEMAKQTQKQSDLATGAGFGLANSLGAWAAKDKDKDVHRQLEQLDSPAHLNELRKIKAQTALTGLMSDPENPLSQHDPEAVLNSYNKLVQLAPRLADQPAILGPLLNKQLVGNIEPFELLDTLKMESGLKKVQPKPTYYTGKPESGDREEDL